jgi:hypothetical protein
MITSRASNRPSSIQQLQNIVDIFKILKEPFFKNNLVTSESDKKIRVNDLYKKFNELSGDSKVEFYNDFITKCWDYFLREQQKIDNNPRSNQAKLNKLNIDKQLQILRTFKQFLIIKNILPKSSDSISPPNSIDSLLISWTPIARTSIVSGDSMENTTNSSLRRFTDNSRNSYYFNSRSKTINDLDEIKSTSNPRDNLFFKKYLLKHLELIDLYQKQNNELNYDYQAQLDKYKNQARESCLDYLLLIINSSSQQNFNLDLGNILPIEHNKRYLEELKKLKAKLKGLNYEALSKRKLNEFLSNEIEKVNIGLGKDGINSTRSTYPFETRSLGNYPEKGDQRLTTRHPSSLLSRVLRGDVSPNRISLSQIPTDHPNKPVASILRSDNYQKKQPRNLKFYFPPGEVPKERLKGYEELKKIEDKSKFNSLQTIRNSR